ncbi:major facilitator superfamily protein [Stylonychia lemnae]|uniref:Major facilitator superfamily protein n=1 Tax=Stylonychia lemnae TaxID=5949 RepID=A0A078B761_STYLE|nr:major facilitator superfamily protein [Stylonychia lemnae]|eukprot:CDW90244.1 major facilitator superfamily protein [Stylonychia lemnae]
MTLNKTEETQSFVTQQPNQNSQYGDEIPKIHRKKVSFIFALTFCNYGVLHGTRAAWSNATPQIESQYDYSSKLISYMNSTFLFFYATAGIFSGNVADRFKKNQFIFVTYVVIGLNIILVGSQQFFVHQQMWLYFLLRIIDGTFQSIGWSTNLSVLSNWFPKHGRGLLIGCWASNANVGDIVGAQIYRSAIKDDNSNWGTGIMINGTIVVIFAFLNLFFLIEFPEKKGIKIEENSHLFQKVEEIKAEEATTSSNDKQSIGFLKALMIPGVLIFSISFFLIKFSMYGFYYWLPNYIQNGLGYSKDTSANIFSLFSTGSIVGNILLGLTTDFLPYRSPVFLIGTTLASLMTLALTIWNSNDVVIISVLMFFLGFSLNGSTIVIAAIECDLGKQQALKDNEKAMATLSGIIDGIAGFGSILGLPIIQIKQNLRQRQAKIK